MIDTERHTVSSRRLGVKNYGLVQTIGGHYAVPVAEFSQQMFPTHEPELTRHLEAAPVYHAEPAGPQESVTSKATPAMLRSFARHDRNVLNAVGPGKRGPDWSTVVRRSVFDSSSGLQLLDEEVAIDTRLRRPLPHKTDTVAIFMYRISDANEVSGTEYMTNPAQPSSPRPPDNGRPEEARRASPTTPSGRRPTSPGRSRTRGGGGEHWAADRLEQGERSGRSISEPRVQSQGSKPGARTWEELSTEISGQGQAEHGKASLRNSTPAFRSSRNRLFPTKGPSDGEQHPRVLLHIHI